MSAFKHLEQLRAIQARLRERFGDREFKLTDVLNEIRKDDLPPFKTRDALLRLDMLTFTGYHAQDQRYKVTASKRRERFDINERIVAIARDRNDLLEAMRDICSELPKKPRLPLVIKIAEIARGAVAAHEARVARSKQS